MTGLREPTVAGADAAVPGRGRVPGEAGVWVFVLGDMAAFAVCFGVLAVTRAADPAAYLASAGRLHLWLGVVNTVVRLTSSLTLALGVRATRLGRTGPGEAAPRLVAATIAGAVVFVALKVTEYAMLLAEGHGPRGGDFFAYYFGFTALHLLHVLIGLVVLVVVLRVARRRAPDRRDVAAVESGAAYWHMVDLLWLVLFALLYLTG